VGDAEGAVVVEADAADAVAAGFYEAAVAAGVAADVFGVGDAFDESFGGGDGVDVEHLLEGFQAFFWLEEGQRAHG
jgi:hypothetical protein